MRLFRIFFLFFFISFTAVAGEIELNGIYQGENLYVKNPYAETGVGFCVFEVMVNGMTTTDEINSNAFEVDVTVYRFRIGDPLQVTIRYKDGCQPSVVNPEVVAPKASFNTIDISLNENILEWETNHEAGSLPFVVEQFRWNKWIKVGAVDGVGTPGKHQYQMPVRLHAGENRFRVSQTDGQNNRKRSRDLTIVSEKSGAELLSDKVEDELVFSVPTLYEIYDSYGRIVFKGFGDTINVNGLPGGEYFLNFGNEMSRFKK
jgi:hypothetical protein